MSVSIQVELYEKINYSMYHNQLPVISAIDITNEGEVLDNLVFKIYSDTPFFKFIETPIDSISERSVYHFADDITFKFQLLPEFFKKLTERVLTAIKFELWSGNEVLAQCSSQVELLTFDTWPGTQLMPELIAAFVTPNVDGLAKVRAKASDVLKKWGENSAFDGYAGDRNRVKKIVAAIYAAVCELNLNYVRPPVNFSQVGQRIRLPEDVLNQKQGTCLDLAVLFASLFESIDLLPIIFFINGHAFTGVHLDEENVSQMVGYENGYYQNAIQENEICAIECTYALNYQNKSFEEATEAGFKNLADPEAFCCSVEIHNARQKIHPLPVFRHSDKDWVVKREDLNIETTAPKSIRIQKPVKDNDKKLTTLDLWKNDLLDLTSRNYLIRMKPGKKILPLLIPDVNLLVDKLTDGDKFTFVPKPLEWNGTAQYNVAPFETPNYLGNGTIILTQDLKKKYIHAPLPKDATEDALRSISRQATQLLEESGCNSLFVQVGTLKWYEQKTNTVSYAPLLLIPVQMKNTMKGFTIEKIDEDILFNVTLQEKLKQEYGISLPIPDPLCDDDGKVDIAEIIHIVRQSIKKKSNWIVFEGASLGVFSFSQYAMWKDLDSNIDSYKKNPIVGSLLKGTPYPRDTIEFDADPYKGCLVVPADGSQVNAVNASLEHSFVMHGPPGTGKSQTITNIIANAMMSGKTVLFVAEKRAALEVVKKRLDEIGIGNHCLALHSNKTTKTEVISQLRKAFDNPLQYEDRELKTLEKQLLKTKENLDKYSKQLHKPMIDGLSMYDLISLYEENDIEDAYPINFSNSVNSITVEEIDQFKDDIEGALIISDRIADIDQHILKLIGTDDTHQTLEVEARDAVNDLRTATQNREISLQHVRSLNVKYDPLDFTTSDSYYKRLFDLNSDILHDTNCLDHPQSIDSLNESISSANVSLHSSMYFLRKISDESINELKSIADKIKTDQDHFLSLGYPLSDASVTDLLDQISKYCQQAAEFKDKLIQLHPIRGKQIIYNQKISFEFDLLDQMLEGRVSQSRDSFFAEFKQASSKWYNVDDKELVDLSARSERIKDICRYFEYHAYDEALVLKDFDDVKEYCEIMADKKTILAEIGKFWKKEIFDRQDAYKLYQQYGEINNLSFFKKGKAKKEFVAQLSSVITDPNIKFKDYGPSLKLVEEIYHTAKRLLFLSRAIFKPSNARIKSDYSFDAAIAKIQNCLTNLDNNWKTFTSRDLDELLDLTSQLNTEFDCFVKNDYLENDVSFHNLFGMVGICQDSLLSLLNVMNHEITVKPVLTDLKSCCNTIQRFCDDENCSLEELVKIYDHIAPVQYAAEKDLQEKHNIWENNFDALAYLLTLNVEKPLPDLATNDSLKLCDEIESVSDRVLDITSWHEVENKFKRNGLEQVIPHLLEGASEDVLVCSVYKAVYKKCLEYCRQSLEMIKTFGQVSFEKSIHKFREEDKRYIDLNSKILQCHLYQNLPNDSSTVSGSETNTLNRALKATRLRKSIRTLLSQTSNVIMRVCPCFLMSPLSVSQYLSSDFNKFDLVIFDESSQITTPKAICSLGRAHLAIVAGDNKQLPPTSFFQSKSESEDEDLIVLDSFLDDCLALNLPEVYLEWHYRSHHESLIAFSNREFYSDKMLTFPSSNDAETKVYIVKVPNGIYERGRGRNEPEAKAIVDEIYRRVMDPELSKSSLGVIAFSTRQETCIYNLLENRKREDEAFFNRFNDMPEGVFLKNLETVQGDERDVILFSIGYGPNKEGVVYQNFGPLNQAGGGRRLNVAVSRARSEMIVFTSMNSSDVKYTPNSGDGVKGLREFLRYAENNGRFEEEDRTVLKNGQNSAILRSIVGELQATGYICHYCVGSSRFYVDIAVLDPNDHNHYLLGILSDGELYYKSDNTRDREYAREDVLKNLGWNIIHVWSVEWYNDRNKVIKKIFERLQLLESGQISDLEEEQTTDQDEEVRTRMYGRTGVHTSHAIQYKPSDFVTHPEMWSDQFWNPSTLLNEIINEESPINEEYLLKVYRDVMGIKRLTEDTKNWVKHQMNSIGSEKIGPFTTFWSPNSNHKYNHYRLSNTYPRTIEQIPLPELCVATEEAVQEEGSLGRDDLIIAVARKFNFARTTDTIREIVNNVISIEIKKKKLIQTENGRIMLPQA